MIHESNQQMPETPDLVVTCVGGGGLLNGIVQGMRAVGWQQVIIIVLEVNCFSVK